MEQGTLSQHPESQQPESSQHHELLETILPNKLNKAGHYLSDEAKVGLLEAYHFAKDAHNGQFRKSGEPYIIHPVAVTQILAEMQLDVGALIGGLLHDTVEDTPVSLEQIAEHFGDDIARIVEGETKISRRIKVGTQAEDKSQAQAEYLKQMFLGMVDDVRIILVKLADRLHNMRTLGAMPEHKQRRIANETLEIFAPLADLLGINHIKSELQNLGFLYAEPEMYREIEQEVRTASREREKQVKRSEEMLVARLKAEGLEADVSGRSKQLYSIYRKMQRDNKSLEQIFDLMAVRAILKPNPNDNFMTAMEQEKALCYRTLGIVHATWTPIPGRFKDYVAAPKHNGYQSLHTTVIGFDGQPIEVQIRTERMHEIAENGVAAHWAYKEGLDDTQEVGRRLEWMRQLLDLDSLSENAGLFIDTVKNDLFSERVYVFTPKGKVINLPWGSTPLDFAYQVHTQVGHTCVGAKANGVIVPLTYTLQTGDRIEILTNRQANAAPSVDWLNIVQTRSAKQKIRYFLRQQEKQEHLAAGKRSLEKALRRKHLSVNEYTSKVKLEEVARQLLHSDNSDDLFLALGNKRLMPKQVLAILAPESAKPSPKPKRPAPKTGSDSQAILVDGFPAVAHMGRCCSPVPGDDIVGYVTRGRGVTVHRVNCANVRHLLAKESERIAQVSWRSQANEQFLVDLEVIAYDRPRLLEEVLGILGMLNKSALRVAAQVPQHNEARIHFRVNVKDQAELDHLQKLLLNVENVREVRRIKIGFRE